MTKEDIAITSSLERDKIFINFTGVDQTLHIDRGVADQIIYDSLMDPATHGMNPARYAALLLVDIAEERLDSYQIELDTDTRIYFVEELHKMLDSTFYAPIDQEEEKLVTLR